MPKKNVRTYLAIINNVPLLGQTLKNFLRFNPKTNEWDEFIESPRITDIYCFGDGYAIYTESNTIYLAKIR